VQEGDYVAKGDGFVAIRDINPRADTHLLVLPERHVPTFREVGEFPPDEAKRMLDFVAQTAREAGLEDYRNERRSPSARSREGNHVSPTSPLL
jgi:histidine triad (HIT) family protein